MSKSDLDKHQFACPVIEAQLKASKDFDAHRAAVFAFNTHLEMLDTMFVDVFAKLERRLSHLNAYDDQMEELLEESQNDSDVALDMYRSVMYALIADLTDCPVVGARLKKSLSEKIGDLCAKKFK